MTDKEKKEFAERLRYHAFAVGDMTIDEQHKLADDLDPPRPEPGAVVWWRDHAEMPWHIGIATIDGVFYINKGGYLRDENWDLIEYKPARILAPGQVAVTIPPVSEWPDDVGSIAWRMIPLRERTERTIITRAEAERMEDES